jgi:hypothetical protein
MKNFTYDQCLFIREQENEYLKGKIKRIEEETKRMKEETK